MKKSVVEEIEKHQVIKVSFIGRANVFVFTSIHLTLTVDLVSNRSNQEEALEVYF
jgi:hypothetical protein